MINRNDLTAALNDVRAHLTRPHESADDLMSLLLSLRDAALAVDGALVQLAQQGTEITLERTCDCCGAPLPATEIARFCASCRAVRIRYLGWAREHIRRALRNGQ